MNAVQLGGKAFPKPCVFSRALSEAAAAVVGRRVGLASAAAE